MKTLETRKINLFNQIENLEGEFIRIKEKNNSIGANCGAYDETLNSLADQIAALRCDLMEIVKQMANDKGLSANLKKHRRYYSYLRLVNSAKEMIKIGKERNLANRDTKAILKDRLIVLRRVRLLGY